MKKKTTIKDFLTGIIPEKILNNINRSFEIVGDIAIIELDENEIKFEKEIGNAIMKVNKSIKTVLKKSGIHKGEFRTQDLIYVAGENKKETIYQENGVLLKINPGTVYFSARLSVERQNLMENLKEGKKVLIMFSGIGPYSFVALKKQPNLHRITSIELNPEGHKFAYENLKLNKNLLKKSNIFKEMISYFKKNKIRINEKELIENLNYLKINFINGDVKEEVKKINFKEIGNEIEEKLFEKELNSEELFNLLKNEHKNNYDNNTINDDDNNNNNINDGNNENRNIIYLNLNLFNLELKKIFSYFLILFCKTNTFICKIKNKNYLFDSKISKGYLLNYLENENDFENVMKFDEIFMPLPKSAGLFLEDAFKVSKKDTVIHMYDFILEKDFPKKTEDEVKNIAIKKNKKIEILQTRKVGQYAPGKYRICCDFKILN